MQHIRVPAGSTQRPVADVGELPGARVIPWSGTERVLNFVQRNVKHFLSVVLVVTVGAVLAGCGEESGSAHRPRVVEDPPRIELDGAPPYGPGIDVGESYDYVLYTHCGIEWAPIDGVWWQTDPLDDGNANPPQGWGNPYDTGQLTVGTTDTARYTSDTGIEVEFRRTDITEAPFACD